MKRLDFKDTKTTYDEMAKLIKVQAQQTEKQIKEEFARLHRFLAEEEEDKIRTLREEESQKSQVITRKIEEIQKEINSLSDKINAIEKEMGTKDIIMLQNFKSTMESSECTLEEPTILSGALVDVAKHLGNLKFKLWEKMGTIVQYTPFVFDPNTAHASIRISDNLLSIETVHRMDRPSLPSNPERSWWRSFMGSQGFRSGSHVWDVDVGDGDCWDVGVTTESNWKTSLNTDCELIWRAAYREGYLHYSGPVYEVKEKLRILRVHLDIDCGELTFSDPLQDKHLFTLQCRFEGTLYPCFYSLGGQKMAILPKEVSVIFQDAIYPPMARHNQAAPTLETRSS